MDIDVPDVSPPVQGVPSSAAAVAVGAFGQRCAARVEKARRADGNSRIRPVLGSVERLSFSMSGDAGSARTRAARLGNKTAAALVLKKDMPRAAVD